MDKLRRIQLCELSIMEEIDRICRKNNIEYWMAYGTMLGAVRHKGFIPWDDDADIYMTYKSFRKFEKICSTDLNKFFFLQTPRSERTMNWIYFKMRKNNTVMLEPGQNVNDELHKGIWVDIFPLVSLANSVVLRRIQIQCIVILQILRCQQPLIRKKKSFKEFLKTIWAFKLSLFEKMMWMILLLLGSFGNKDFMAIVNIFGKECFDWNIIENSIFSKSLFQSTTDYEFEGKTFWGINDYNKYLSQRYTNDYMTPVQYNSHVDSYDKVIL